MQGSPRLVGGRSESGQKDGGWGMYVQVVGLCNNNSWSQALTQTYALPMQYIEYILIKPGMRHSYLIFLHFGEHMKCICCTERSTITILCTHGPGQVGPIATEPFTYLLQCHTTPQECPLCDPGKCSFQVGRHELAAFIRHKPKPQSESPCLYT